MYQDKGHESSEQNEEEKPYTFSDEKTKEKIQRHLSDPHDVISENDIRNVKIPGSEDPVPKQEEDTPSDEKGSEKKIDKGTEGKPTTPWDVLD